MRNQISWYPCRINNCIYFMYALVISAFTNACRLGFDVGLFIRIGFADLLTTNCTETEDLFFRTDMDVNALVKAVIAANGETNLASALIGSSKYIVAIIGAY